MHAIETIMRDSEASNDVLESDVDGYQKAKVGADNDVLNGDDDPTADPISTSQDATDDKNVGIVKESSKDVTFQNDQISGVKASEIVNDEDSAIAQAIATVNASYVPSPSLMHDPNPKSLLASIDGHPLTSYDNKPSVYSARNVPVAVRGKLTVPIYVTVSGSVVDYSVETKYYDISFGIMAEREEGITTVVDLARVDSHISAVTGKFLVVSVPCALVFIFDNEYSWFREKTISYKITITPPAVDHIIAGRKVRAKIALQHVVEDKLVAEERLQQVSTKRSSLIEEINQLEKELLGKKETHGVLEKEEEWLVQRVALRKVQEEELHKRLTSRFDDYDQEISSSTDVATVQEGISSYGNIPEIERCEV